MFDDFFLRALAAGIGVALVAGPLGCFVVWRRLAYMGDTLAHGALLGVALAALLELPATLAVLAVSIVAAIALLAVEKRAILSTDAVLGLLSHAMLAVGLVLLSFMTWVRIDLLALLFGDILSVGWVDVAAIWVAGAVVLGVLATVWNALFAATVSPEIARAEGLSPVRAQFIFTLLLAATIALAVKVVGVLLVTAMLIIPAATARRVASSPEGMALAAAGMGALAAIVGLLASLAFDTPSGPSIVVAAFVMFVVAMAVPRR
ncbi:metal ABC transporter permease [Rhizobiaceae bacterium]|nr:metal ABC transporter permease [Rhizobiaceae bacterium]